MEFFGKINYINVINVEWRGEKSKKSINVEGGFIFCGGWNVSKLVSVTSRLLVNFVNCTFYKLEMISLNGGLLQL